MMVVANGIPRINKAHAEALIVDEHVRYISETRTTICSVRLINEQTVTEFATCGVDQTFDPIKGRTIARKKVLNEIIKHEHYLLRQRLYEAKKEKENGSRT
jgi:hypothetical protein